MSAAHEFEEWLKSIGLSEYGKRFAENGIDLSTLPDITEDDLKELGVLLGHRRKLLREIGALRGPAPSASLISKSSVESAVERRQLTVMFCDLVGSTALSARLDPEDMRAIIGAYHKAVAKAVQAQDGFVAKYMGDGVLAYFGYPAAHEDDAERAVHAGLAITDAAPKLESLSGETLHVRVGIATGVVIVGDLVGSGESSERGVVGDTPNLAARLQGIAEPDRVVIAEATRRLIGDLFELSDLGPVQLKGIAGAPRAYEVVRTRPANSRFEAMRGNLLTPLIGREAEIEFLSHQWSKAKAGEGHVAHLSGEAGIGKSRLTAAFAETLIDTRMTHLRYFCSPQHTRSAFHPFIGQMERAAELAHDDSQLTRLDKLDKMLAQLSTAVDDTALFVEMLSVPNDGRYPALDLAPAQRRSKTLEALITQIIALAEQNPLLIIFEDAHWADPTSLEVLSRLIERMQALRALLIVTSRPEFEPPWMVQAHMGAISINRLTKGDAVAMVDRLVGNKLVTVALRQDIIERTDGIPLFVEEMTKAVLEAESESEARRTVAVASSSVVSVPASLQASLMARLDRLGVAKEVAQVGAAIGREFPHGLIAAVLDRPAAELASSLDRLLDAGLLFRQGDPPDASYIFKHALVQDAAYGTLLRERRRALHARIAEVLESQFADYADRQPELLARHYTEAAISETAARLWCKAGRQSLERSAFVEAVSHFTRGLSQYESLPITGSNILERIEAEVGLGDAFVEVDGHAAVATRAAFRRAHGLVKHGESLGALSGDLRPQISVLRGLWLNAFVAFDGDLMHELARELLELTERQSESRFIAMAHSLSAWTRALAGNLVEGRAHADRAVGIGTHINVLCVRALILWVLGYPDASQADIDRAVTQTSQIGHVGNLMLVLGISNYTNILCGNAAAVTNFSERLTVLSNERSASLRKAEALFQKGCAEALNGSAAGAVQTITSGVNAWRATGSTCWTPLQMTFLAGVHAQLGQLRDARRCIDEAMAASAASKERWCDADIHRIAGEISLLSNERDTSEAEKRFRLAMSVAREQQAKSFELRAATDLAELLRRRGEGAAARDLLSPIYGWFTEGHGTRDLRKARDVLASL